MKYNQQWEDQQREYPRQTEGYKGAGSLTKLGLCEECEGNVARGWWVQVAKPKTGEEGREQGMGLHGGAHYHISRLQKKRKSTLQQEVQHLKSSHATCIVIQQMETAGQAQPVWCEGASGVWLSHSRVVPKVHLLCCPYFVIQYLHLYS